MLRQLHFSELDLVLHSRFQPREGATVFDSEEVKAVEARTTVLPPLPEDRSALPLLPNHLACICLASCDCHLLPLIALIRIQIIVTGNAVQILKVLSRRFFGHRARTLNCMVRFLWDAVWWLHSQQTRIDLHSSKQHIMLQQLHMSR